MGHAIYGSLLPDGRALITGSGRFDRQDCRIHRTRQNGESFVLGPRDLTGGAPPTHRIAPIDEQPRPGFLDVLYGAGGISRIHCVISATASG